MNIVIASEVGLKIAQVADVLDAIGQCYGTDGLLLTEDDLAPAFFDLRSGLAGALFQKCTNYQIPLALVVKDVAAYSPRIAELVYEHHNHRLIRFFANADSALAWLEQKS